MRSSSRMTRNGVPAAEASCSRARPEMPHSAIRGVIVDDQNRQAAQFLETKRSRERGTNRGFLKLGREEERRPLAFGAFHPHLAAHHLHDPPGNGEAQAGAAVLARSG